MTVLNVLLSFLLPALGGLIVGFPSGVITTLYWVGRRRARGETVPTYTDTDNPTPGHVPWRGREHLSRVGWILVIAGILGFIGGVTGLVQSNNTQNCLRSYIQQSSAVNQERGAAAETDRQGIRQVRQVDQEFYQLMIEAVTHPVTDPEGQAKARQDFLVKAQDWDARLAEADRLDRAAEQKRQNNPLPAPPAC